MNRTVFHNQFRMSESGYNELVGRMLYTDSSPAAPQLQLKGPLASLLLHFTGLTQQTQHVTACYCRLTWRLSSPLIIRVSSIGRSVVSECSLADHGFLSLFVCALTTTVVLKPWRLVLVSHPAVGDKHPRLSVIHHPLLGLLHLFILLGGWTATHWHTNDVPVRCNLQAANPQLSSQVLSPSHPAQTSPP